MSFRAFQISGLLLAGLVTAACDGGRQTQPDVRVRAVHAAPSQGTLDFRREQTTPTTLGFGASSDFAFDQDRYDFYVDDTLPGATSAVTVASFTQTIDARNEYTFVLAEQGGVISPVILETPLLAAGSAGGQLVALHVNEVLPAVDVYVEPAGAGIAAAAPKASLAFGESLPAQPLAAGDYEVTLTDAGNAASVLLITQPFTVEAAGTTALVIVDLAGSGTTPIGVLALGATATALLFDRDAPSALRASNTATDTAARDFALDGELGTPAFPAVGFAAITEYRQVAGGDHTLDVTAAGNPGAIELTQTLALARNGYYTVLVSGDAGALVHVLVADDRRRLAEEAKLRLYNGSSQFASLDFFLVPPGSDVAGFFPLTTLGAQGGSALSSVAPGDYDLVLRDSVSAAILAGPLPVTLAAGGLYGVLAVNGPDAATARIELLDDF